MTRYEALWRARIDRLDAFLAEPERLPEKQQDPEN
jgi:hypothetical protein